ncbi:hypothetical protein IPN41_02725 [Candidatus Falkowbacteria bacterium]|nr:MAG: hypothetical protein IPN41_02725 [Candidatus Falkowbacteria bacterium]
MKKMLLNQLSKKVTITQENLFLALYISLVSAYVLIRAFSVSVVHDEAITYFISLNNFSTLFNFPSFGGFAVNNHILNTILIKFFEMVFGQFNFIFRLPAILGFALYLWYSVKISKILFTKKWIIISVIALTLNPFLLEFFSLARGYSLGLGFLMGSLYYFFLSFSKKATPNTLFNLIICGLLASFANFTFITPFLIIIYVRIAIYINTYIRNKKTRNTKNLIKQTIIPAVATPLLLYILLGPQLLFLKKAGLLYVGGNSGFFTDTVMSVIKASLYNPTISLAISYIPAIIIILFFVIGGGVILYMYKKKSKVDVNSTAYIYLIIILLFFASFLQHLIFKTPFVSDRAVIYFIPIVMLSLVLIFKTLYLTIKDSGKMYVLAVGLTLMLCLTFNFIINANLSYTYIWKYDSDTKNILADIDLIHQASPQSKLLIWNNWKLMPSINYIKQTDSIGWLPWASTLPPTPNYNVYILLPDDYQLIEIYSLQIIKEYKNSQAILAIRTKNPTPPTPSVEQ